MRQGRHGLVVGQEHLAAEVLQKVGALQAVHDRTLDFAQVQGDALVGQALHDGLQAVERAGVDVVDRRALQHHVPQAGAGGHGFGHAVFEVAGIGKEQALVDPQAQHI
ncbi:hypothetical protein RZS08_27675, partial [Arthrospira platensis SPKY1]|nr:hypothetical protein [Arthrospira platensis SPKY1]